MKRMVFILLGVLSVAVSPAFGLDLGLGLKAPNPPSLLLPEPPLFLAPPTLGFQVASGTPYDMVLISGRYYMFYGDVWYMSRSYNGPWGVTKHKNLPPSLRKHNISIIRSYRDKEYKNYMAKRGHDRGPGHGTEHGAGHVGRGGHRGGKH